MAMQISDSMIAGKVDRVAEATELSMTAKVELALDLWLSEMSGASDQSEHMAARIAQLDGTPHRAGSSEPLN